MGKGVEGTGLLVSVPPVLAQVASACDQLRGRPNMAPTLLLWLVRQQQTPDPCCR